VLIVSGQTLIRSGPRSRKSIAIAAMPTSYLRSLLMRRKAYPALFACGNAVYRKEIRDRAHLKKVGEKYEVFDIRI